MVVQGWNELFGEGRVVLTDSFAQVWTIEMFYSSPQLIPISAGHLSAQPLASVSLAPCDILYHCRIYC